MSGDHPAITFVNFFREKYLMAVYKYIIVIPALRLAVCSREAPDEKLKPGDETKPAKLM